MVDCAKRRNCGDIQQKFHEESRSKKTLPSAPIDTIGLNRSHNEFPNSQVDIRQAVVDLVHKHEQYEQHVAELRATCDELAETCRSHDEGLKDVVLVYGPSIRLQLEARLQRLESRADQDDHEARLAKLEEQVGNSSKRVSEQHVDELKPTIYGHHAFQTEVPTQFSDRVSPLVVQRLEAQVQELSQKQQNLSAIVNGALDQLRSALVTLQQSVGESLEAHDQKFANLEGRVEKQEETLASLQKHVTQLSDPQQEMEEHVLMEDCQPSVTQPDVSPVRTVSAGHDLTFEYNWQQSIWDVSMFIGTELLGTGSSLAAGTCLVLYLVLCAMLVTESGEAMSQQKFFGTDTQGEFQYWRSTIAHDLSFRIPVTGESLASSVCNHRLYVPYANLQQDAVGVLSEYLQGHPVLGTSVKRGVVMCSLVLSVWFLKIMEEFASTFGFLLACLHLPISKRVTFQQDAMDPSVVEFVSLSRVRLLIMMVLVTARVFVAFFVMWFGSRFLIFETSLTDMVLNSMAMGMILDLDELIFFALLPKKPSRLIDKISPLKYELRYRKRCLAWLQLAYVVLVMVSGAIIKILVLDPFVVELQNNLHALCGGFDDSSLDFVMKVDSIGVPWAVATPNSRPLAETYAQHTVFDVIKSGFPEPTIQLTGAQRTNVGLFMQLRSSLELETYVATQAEFKDPQSWTIFNIQEMPTVLGWNEALVLGGTDFGDGLGTVYNRYLQFLLGLSGKASCADIPLHKCYESGHEGLVMRKLCPSWCGCDLPTGGTVSNAVADNGARHVFPGCSAWVIGKRRFRDTLRDLPCVDTISSDVFISWLRGIGDHRVPRASGLLADQLLSSFETGGCHAVARTNLGIEGARICVESSLPAVCPVSCGCDENANWSTSHAWRMDYCPQDCGKLQSFTCFTISVNHTVDTGSFGPLVDYPCVFPFKYKDKTYNKCVRDDWIVPWCAVTLQNGRLYHWGDCPPDC